MGKTPKICKTLQFRETFSTKEYLMMGILPFKCNEVRIGFQF